MGAVRLLLLISPCWPAIGILKLKLELKVKLELETLLEIQNSSRSLPKKAFAPIYRQALHCGEL